MTPDVSPIRPGASFYERVVQSLSKSEINRRNAATGIIKELRSRGLINDFEKGQLEAVLELILDAEFRGEAVKHEANAILEGRHSPTAGSIASALIAGVDSIHAARASSPEEGQHE
jgi:hypothetical protein